MKSKKLKNVITMPKRRNPFEGSWYLDGLNDKQKKAFKQKEEVGKPLGKEINQVKEK
ncbi:hypothetical protein [Fructilactobacillus fructivorans]|uniref:hypothetical protein n=1 Tax=Fructilactobacillus fructivorans TaxID=1614 RepID=UPI0002196CBB|nr:hypothetical protein [Fructilactobacillus fructivorans]KRK58117.1 hypothetical protein FC73_GL000496 [Fructilactobacillus fructivorans]KRN42854.1 hypothetical protein IV48_GL001080 [Fructilactobacillus fructivorans]